MAKPITGEGERPHTMTPTTATPSSGRSEERTRGIHRLGFRATQEGLQALEQEDAGCRDEREGLTGERRGGAGREGRQKEVMPGKRGEGLMRAAKNQNKGYE